MALTARLDRFQQSHPWVGFPLAVIYKFTDDQGGYLTATLAYFSFLSLFPMLLLLTTRWASCWPAMSQLSSRC